MGDQDHLPISTKFIGTPSSRLDLDLPTKKRFVTNPNHHIGNYGSWFILIWVFRSFLAFLLQAIHPQPITHLPFGWFPWGQANQGPIHFQSVLFQCLSRVLIFDFQTTSSSVRLVLQSNHLLTHLIQESLRRLYPPQGIHLGHPLNL